MSNDTTTRPPDAPTDAPTDPPFDPSTLTAEDAPFPGMPDAPKPDHTASADPEPDAHDNVRPIGSARPFSRSRKSGKDSTEKKAPGERGYVPPKRPGQLVKPLTNLYVSVGAAVSAFDPVCGMVVLDNAEKCAESLDALAQRNEAVRRALFAMLETSAWGGVLAAHLPLLVMVLVHHGPRDVADKLAPIAAFAAPQAVTMMNAEAAASSGREDTA